MIEADARWVISQVAEATGRSFAEAEIKQLLALTGNYPSLLKAASLWLSRASSIPAVGAWTEALLGERSLRYRLEEIWLGLTQEERLVLSELQKRQSQRAGPKRSQDQTVAPPSPFLDKRWESLSQQQSEVLAHLAIKGVCSQAEEGWRISGDLLAAYIAKVEGRGGGKIWLDEATGELYQGQTPLASLAPLERAVLHFLVRHPRIQHTKTDLIVNTWPDDLRRYGVSDQSLYQLIMDLRKKIEPTRPSPATYSPGEASQKGAINFSRRAGRGEGEKFYVTSR